MRHYYACSICAPGEDYCQENFERITESSGFVLHNETPQKGTFHQISVGDILVLKYNNQFIAYGEVREINITDDPDWNHWANVVEWHYFNPDDRTTGITTYGIGPSTEGGGQFGTVKTLRDTFGFRTISQIESTNALFAALSEERQKTIQMKNIQEKIQILKYKHQIILQGPPGTGKTRLAKQLARKLTEPSKPVSPLEKIDRFFQNFSRNADQEAFIETSQKLLEEFQSTFKKETLKDLTLEEYAIGTGESDNFCWWLERGLKPMGYYFPGSSRSYLIYWNKSASEYRLHGKLMRGIDDPEKGIEVLMELISNLINDKNIDTAREYLGDGFLLKILHSYYPDEYFPINSMKCINNVLKVLNLESEGNPVSKNKAILRYLEDKNKEFGADVTSYEFMGFLFSAFDLKGTITIDAGNIVAQGSFDIVQFHPAYSYEDFVRGITVKTDGKNISYEVEDKILVEFATKAINNPSANFVLIIDEINRANLPSVLGELIYALEYRYDENNQVETSVTSIYSKDLSEEDKIMLPKNLYIIGTMNTSDRSVGHIDYAIRRRFAFIDVLPEVLNRDDFQADAFRKVSSLFISNMNEYEQSEDVELVPSDFLNEEFRPEDVWLGHSYFIANNESFEIRKKYEIVPILKEYIKDGILKNLKETSDLINAL